MLTLLLSTTLTLGLPLMPLSCAPEGATQEPLEQAALGQRLVLLAERLEAQRIANHIPGLALAVVKDDAVILAKGFGLADIDKGRAVDAETIFAVGSTSKAFTSTALGMLQDDGLLDFDDPVVKHLPFFELAVTEGREKAPVLLRDLLCHRTGFTRMTALWAGTSASRQLILETATHAEPTEKLREKFQYNNVMFLAAGVAGGQAAGVEWEELMKTRLLDPLGMTSTTLSIQAAQEDKRLSLGYDWNSDGETWTGKRMVDLHSIAPAGSINSNVLDMAQWVRFQLADGKRGEARLIQRETLLETRTPNIEMGSGSSYGLGWMIHGTGADQVIEHGGNIDGFSAQVAFMPGKSLGFVLLANVSATPLQAASISLVFDTLLEDIARAEPLADDYEAYVGKYLAKFAPFDGAAFDVNVQEGSLFLDVPGQTNYELEAPDEQGKWHFKISDAIAVSFVRDEAGRPTTLVLHQGGANMEMVREGLQLPIEVPLDELTKFLGEFRDPALKEDVRVVIENDHLALNVPSQRIYELRAPDPEGKWAFRMIDQIQLRFNEDADGAVQSITMFERGSQRELLRLKGEAGEASAELPSLEEFYELRVLGGIAQLLAQHGSLRATGSIRVPQSGILGTYEWEATREPRASRLVIDLGPFGLSVHGSDGESAWTYSKARGYQELHGKSLLQALRGHPALAEGDWRTTFESTSIQAIDKVQGLECVKVKLRTKDLPAATAYVDLVTGEVLRLDSVYPEGPVQVPLQTTYEDFKEVLGVNVAHTTTESNPMTGASVMKLESLEAGIELPADFATYKGKRD